MTQTISFGYGSKPAQLLSNKLNRHGVIAGATGTGKTVTLKVLAEQLSEAGVPVLLSDIKGDLASLAEKGEVTESFKNAVDTVFAISGCVGCFGVHYGRMAGAHAVHNGMSLVKETHKVLHGTKVSYGILVQLLAEGKKEEVLIPFYKENDLAYNLACVNVVEDVEEKIEKIAEFAASEKESFKLAVDVCTPEVVATAMRQLEEMTK